MAPHRVADLIGASAGAGAGAGAGVLLQSTSVLLVHLCHLNVLGAASEPLLRASERRLSAL